MGVLLCVFVLVVAYIVTSCCVRMLHGVPLKTHHKEQHERQHHAPTTKAGLNSRHPLPRETNNHNPQGHTMNQQQQGHHTWPDTYCDECGQPTTTWPGNHYTLCIDCATETAA